MPAQPNESAIGCVEASITLADRATKANPGLLLWLIGVGLPLLVAVDADGAVAAAAASRRYRMVERVDWLENNAEANERHM